MRKIEERSHHTNEDNVPGIIIRFLKDGSLNDVKKGNN